MSATQGPVPTTTTPAPVPAPRPGADEPVPDVPGPPDAPDAPGARESPAAPVLARHRQPRNQRRRVPRAALAAAAVVLVWLVAVWAAPRVQVGPSVHELARFTHLAALVFGFGAALLVEWFGLLWLLRRRPLTAVTQVAHGAHLPIWLGLAGLTASGVVLSPAQLTAAGTVKLGAVLVVGLNGIYASRVQRRLTATGSGVPRRALARAGATATVSQLGWWTAVTIGFLSSHTS